MKSIFDQRKVLAAPVGLAIDLCRQCGTTKEGGRKHKHTSTEAQFLKEFLKKDKIPVPDTEDREGYQGPYHFDYWLSGLSDYSAIHDIVGELPSQSVIVDFGGASGRVARFFATGHPEARLTVAELNVNHVDYITRYFPDNTRAMKLSAYPHFMLPDNTCDFLYAFSVFTHIDVYEQSWLAEISRILKPGGKAYLTIHDETSWANLEKMFVYSVLKNSPNFMEQYAPGKPMPQERLVYEYCASSNEYNCNVFHHTDYIHRIWSKWLNIVRIVPSGHELQTVVLLEKK